MNKVAQAVCLVLVLGLAVIGCGKKSGLEGKVVDGKGNPISGIKIIAKQEETIKGGEQLEAITGSDGSFKLNRLSPLSPYTLVPWKQDTKFSASVTMQSGSESQTIILPKPFVIRFMQTGENIIKDSATGLQWLPDLEGKDITWDEAQAYVRGLKAGGFSDWRLPAKAELKSLYDPNNPSFKAGYNKIDSLFQLSTCCVWTGEFADPSSAGFFRFYDGLESKLTRSTSKNLRVLAVHPQK